MADKITIDGKEFKDLQRTFEKLGSAEFKKEVGIWLEAEAFIFSDEIKAEIIRTKTVDTRRLLNSFDKSKDGNVWRIKRGGLELRVGTNVKYAAAVNDGHSTTPKGISQRWVPGVWEGDKFTYTKGAKTGMLLREKWVEGTHYFDNAVKVFEKMFGKSLDKNLARWLDKF